MMDQSDKIDDLRVMREVTDLIALSSAKVRESIVVVGPQSLEYLVALLRSGFERVACMSTDRPFVCDELIDRLFVCGAMRDDQVSFLFGSIGRRLNRGGAIVVQLQKAGEDQAISQALRDAGLSKLREIHANFKDGPSIYGYCQPDFYAIAA